MQVRHHVAKAFHVQMVRMQRRDQCTAGIAKIIREQLPLVSGQCINAGDMTGVEYQDAMTVISLISIQVQ